MDDNYQITFKPYRPKRSIALSVITHTPTQRSSKNSVGFSAISHTPTERIQNQSVALSALHLSQYNRDENASYKSVALSAFKVIESKFSGAQTENPSKEEIKQAPSDKHVSKSSNSKKIKQPSDYESSNKISSKKSSKQDYSCQVVHGRDQQESHPSLRNDREIALDPFKQNSTNRNRKSHKAESEETNNLNKQLQVSDNITIELNYHQEKSVKISPNIGMKIA